MVPRPLQKLGGDSPLMSTMMVEPTEALEDIFLDDDRSDRISRINTQASPLVCKELTFFLKNNLDVFAWSHEDMPGIDPSIVVHQLNVSSSFPPTRQKKKVFTQEGTKLYLRRSTSCWK